MRTLSVNEVAEELHTDRNKIYELLKEGALIGIKKGNTSIIPEFELDRFCHDWLGLDISTVSTIREGLMIIESRRKKC